MATNYAIDLLTDISPRGMTGDLWELACDDAKKLRRLNVGGPKHRNLYFYLDNFCDDLCDEFNCEHQDRKEDILSDAFKYLRDNEKVDLTDIREAVSKAIGALKTQKLAYPNTMGVSQFNAKPERDVQQWIKALGKIYNEIQRGKSKSAAIQNITEGWSPMAKIDFESWLRYYERGDHEKYNVRTAAPFSFPQFLLDPKLQDPKPTPVVPAPSKMVSKVLPKSKINRRVEKTPQEIQKALISRLDSADRLLRDFSQVWPSNVWSRLHTMLNDLKREIMLLKSASTMNDRIIRTANLWEQDGFSEGATILRKIAAPPEDITTQIEKALTGREYDTAPADAAPAAGAGPEMPMPEGEMPMPEGEMPMPEGEMPMPEGEPPMPEGEEELAGLEAPPAGAGEELPPPEEAPPEEAPEESKDTSSNPYGGTSVQDVLNVLEPITQKVKDRDIIRELSKVDMMLDAQNIASHFPELGEAMGRSLETTSYVMTRLDKIINKLKGGLSEDKKESEAPDIDMGELAGGGLPPEGLEVTEEEAMAPPPPEVPGPEAPPAAPEPPMPGAEASNKNNLNIPKLINIPENLHEKYNKYIKGLNE